jgi:hypothetical protein
LLDSPKQSTTVAPGEYEFVVRSGTGFRTRTSQREYALSFDGVDVSSLTYEGTHPVTLEAWVTTGELSTKNDGEIQYAHI